MAVVVNCVMENLDNATSRLQVLLENLPVPPCYKSGLVSAVLNKIYSLMSSHDWSPAKQREMIPLIKFCLKLVKCFVVMETGCVRYYLITVMKPCAQ